MNKVDLIGKIGVDALIRVSSVGSGLYLRISNRLAETFDLRPGDRIEVKLQRHYRPKMGPGGKPLT